MKEKRIVAKLFVAAWVAAGSAAAAQARPLPTLTHTTQTLKNGLRVIQHHDPRIPYISVNLECHTGASDESRDERGLAHLFEHLMFEGSQHVGREQHFAELEAAGATSVNAHTSFNHTNYHAVVPKNELSLALWLESDRMGWFLPALSQDKLDEQLRVVKNERLQRYDNRPYGLAEEKAWHALFPPDHPYHGMVIGSMEDLDGLTLPKVRRFYQRAYTPNNFTLVLAGDLAVAGEQYDPQAVLRLVRRYFGRIKPMLLQPRQELPRPMLAGETRLLELERLGKLTKVLVHYLTPELFAPGDAECDVAAHVLTGDRFARLSRVLMHEQQLAQSVASYQSSLTHMSVFTVEALVLPGNDPQKVLGIIDEQVARLVSQPPSAREIQRATNSLHTRQLFALQRLNSRAQHMQIYDRHLGTPDGLAKDLARYHQVTPQGLAQTVQQHLAPDRRVVLIANAVQAE